MRRRTHNTQTPPKKSTRPPHRTCARNMPSARNVTCTAHAGAQIENTSTTYTYALVYDMRRRTHNTHTAPKPVLHCAPQHAARSRSRTCKRAYCNTWVSACPC